MIEVSEHLHKSVKESFLITFVLFPKPVTILSTHNISGAVTNSVTRTRLGPYPALRSCGTTIVKQYQKGKQNLFHDVFFCCFFTDTMNKLKKLVCSRHSYKSYLLKILNNVDEIQQKLSYIKESEPD